MYIKKTKQGVKFYREGKELPYEEALPLFSKGGPNKLDRSLFKDLLSSTPSGDKYVTTVQPSKDKYQEANINASMINLGYKRGGVDSEGFPVYNSDSGDTLIRHSNKLDYVNVGDVSKVAQSVGLKVPATPSVSVAPTISTPAPMINGLTNMEESNRKPIQFGPNQNFDPNTGMYSDPLTGKEITPVVQQFKMGGGNLYKFIGDGYKKLGGSVQGQSMDELLKTKNAEFVNYIAKNTRDAIFRNETDVFQKTFFDDGGEGNPVRSTDPRSDNRIFDTPEADISQGVSTTEPSPFAPTKSVQNKSQNGINPFDAAADTFMLGAQGLNKFFNTYNTQQQDKYNKKKLAIENQVTPTYGSRGDYDVNQGNFRPDQKTFPMFKDGGEGKKHFEYIPYLSPKLNKYDDGGEGKKHFEYIPYLSPKLKKAAKGGEGLSVMKKLTGKNKYKEGGEYSLSSKEISALISDGYLIQFVD